MHKQGTKMKQEWFLNAVEKMQGLDFRRLSQYQLKYNESIIFLP